LNTLGGGDLDIEMERPNPLLNAWLWVPPIGMAVFLIIVAQFSFLAFHTLAELFSIVISFTLFTFALSTHILSRNNFLLFLACGYFWIGGLDLVHTLVYTGMNVFMEGNGNSAVQFWLSARYGEALLLLAAPFAATRRQNGYRLTALFGFIAVGLTGLILSGYFPTGFVPGKGLTDFKIYSEYLIDLILALALVALFRREHGISRDEKFLIAASIVLTMCAEIAFTFYVSVFGLSNLAGHLFKIFSFWMIFQAVVISNLRTPYAALQASEGKFRRLFDNAEVSIWNEDLSAVYRELNRLRQDGVHDLREHLESSNSVARELADMVKAVQVNQATLELFGAETEEEFLNWSNNRFGDIETKIFIDAACAIWDRKRIFRSEAEMRTLDGRVIHVIVSFPIPETENGFHSVPVSIIDITQNRRAEETQRRLATAIDGVAETVSIYDADDKLVYANQALRDMDSVMLDVLQQGKSFEDRIRALLHHYSPADAVGREEAWFAERMEKHRHPGEAFELTRADGITLRLREQKLPDGSIITIGSDISARKKIEEALRDSEQQLRLITDALPVAIFYVDAHMIYRFVNTLAEKFLARSTEEILGSNVREIFDEETYQRLLPRIQAALSGEVQEFEPVIDFPDGETREMAFSYVPHHGFGGEVAGYFGLGIDVTERHALELQLRQAQKMEAIGQLTGGIAHDFNNVLAVILGSLGLLSTNLTSGQNLEQYINLAIAATNRGAALTHRLLAFARKQTLDVQDIDVGGLLDGMDDMLRRSLGETIDLRIQYSAALWLSRIDPGELEQAILNLAVNARDAMPNGGRLTIEAGNKIVDEGDLADKRELTAGEFVVVSVSDIGIGMTPEIQEQIFDPFFTTKEVGEGTGLGLSMVFGFVKQSGGHVVVYSEPGHGTTIHLYLPRSQAVTATPRAVAPLTLARAKPGETILAVEDDPSLRQLIESMLRDLGYTVYIAQHAQDALQLLPKLPRLDLLLTDIVLPGGMSGFELAKAATSDGGSLKILYMSGYAKGALEHQTNMDAGAELLPKPFSMEDLGRMLRKTLDG
jgi:two-component system, cell cycle sensor histidine kinase and response regulator CckA